jgi:hypothetical protein
MAKRIKFSEEEVKEIIRLYNEEKMGTPSIGKLYKVHKAVINRTLRENGVVMDQPGRRNIGGKSAADKRYTKKNKEKLSEYHKEWSDKNRVKLRGYHSEWRDKNRVNINEKTRLWYLNKRRNDPGFRLKCNTRTAIWTCLKERNVTKYRSTFELLGYTLEELMIHLEQQFTEGMTWDNYGEWHVDHKIPMASFNFETTEDREFKLCWSLENLQPLWGLDNLSKGTKLL